MHPDFRLRLPFVELQFHDRTIDGGDSRIVILVIEFLHAYVRVHVKVVSIPSVVHEELLDIISHEFRLDGPAVQQEVLKQTQVDVILH